MHSEQVEEVLPHRDIISWTSKKSQRRRRNPRKKRRTLKINGLILLKHAKPIALAMPHTTVILEVWKKTQMLVSFVNHQIIEEPKKAKAMVSVSVYG